MLYMKEDSSIVRQPIYGLFVGNILTVIIAQLVLLHHSAELTDGMSINAEFLRDMGILMLWGTALLYFDAIGIIMLYERLGKYLKNKVWLRFALSGAVILSFDSVAFYVALHYVFDAPPSVLVDGWRAKMFSVALFTLLFSAYLHMTRHQVATGGERNLRDLFANLTFRERYEDLLSRSGIDVLTGLSDRTKLQIQAPLIFDECNLQGRLISLYIIDIDHFKSVNDTFGHLQGDETLKSFSSALLKQFQAYGHCYRYGGEEFLVILPNLPHDKAVELAERTRLLLSDVVNAPDGHGITVSIGVSTSDHDGKTFNELFSRADERLYKAKNNGRNQICGR